MSHYPLRSVFAVNKKVFFVDKVRLFWCNVFSPFNAQAAVISCSFYAKGGKNKSPAEAPFLAKQLCHRNKTFLEIPSEIGV